MLNVGDKVRTAAGEGVVSSLFNGRVFVEINGVIRSLPADLVIRVQGP